MSFNIADPKYLDHLRDLPTSYLLDMLVDNDDIDADSLYWVLQERGMQRDEVEQRVNSRRKTPWARPYRLWSIARWFTLCNVLVITYFNVSGLYQLFIGDHAFRAGIIFLSVGCIIFGFFVGYKLTTHLYQGSVYELHCGFPIPVGKVDLRSGEEITIENKLMLARMAVNALTGISLTLFPLIFIYLMM